MQAEYLDRKQAAAHLTARGLKVSWRTLQKMATVGGGPIYRTFGTRSVYLAADLDAWAESKLSAPRHSTSEAA